MKLITFPVRYLPSVLTKKDKKAQFEMLMKSKTLYKSNKYYTRTPLASYKNKKSKHIMNARKIYNIKNIAPTAVLAFKTGCKLSALNQIVRKGEGAYYSSGSRPNQTAESWGLARLASSVTSGKSAAVDYDIIKEGCNHKKKAFISNAQRCKMRKCVYYSAIFCRFAIAILHAICSAFFLILCVPSPSNINTLPSVAILSCTLPYDFHCLTDVA